MRKAAQGTGPCENRTDVVKITKDLIIPVSSDIFTSEKIRPVWQYR